METARWRQLLSTTPTDPPCLCQRILGVGAQRAKRGGPCRPGGCRRQIHRRSPPPSPPLLLHASCKWASCAYAESNTAGCVRAVQGGARLCGREPDAACTRESGRRSAAPDACTAHRLWSAAVPCAVFAGPNIVEFRAAGQAGAQAGALRPHPARQSAPAGDPAIQLDCNCPSYHFVAACDTSCHRSDIQQQGRRWRSSCKQP